MKALIASLLVFITCSSFANEFTDRRVITATINAVSTLANADKSCESVADCTTLSLGSRACGGPQSFLVVSRLNANFDVIQSLAVRSEGLESAFNERYGMMSICSMALEKIPQCVANICM